MGRCPWGIDFAVWIYLWWASWYRFVQSCKHGCSRTAVWWYHVMCAHTTVTKSSQSLCRWQLWCLHGCLTNQISFQFVVGVLHHSFATHTICRWEIMFALLVAYSRLGIGEPVIFQPHHHHPPPPPSPSLWNFWLFDVLHLTWVQLYLLFTGKNT